MRSVWGERNGILQEKGTPRGGFFSLILSPNSHFPAFTASRPTFARAPHWVFGLAGRLDQIGQGEARIRGSQPTSQPKWAVALHRQIAGVG